MTEIPKIAGTHNWTDDLSKDKQLVMWVMTGFIGAYVLYGVLADQCINFMNVREATRILRTKPVDDVAIDQSCLEISRKNMCKKMRWGTVTRIFEAKTGRGPILPDIYLPETLGRNGLRPRLHIWQSWS